MVPNSRTAPSGGVMEWRDAKLRPPQKANPKLVAGALAQHLSKVLGAESQEAKKMVFKEVLEFSGQKRVAGAEMNVKELLDLENSLKAKLCAKQSEIRVTRPKPKSSFTPGTLPGVTDNYLEDQKQKLAEVELARHRKFDKKGRGMIRDILQAKTNDPWAVLNRSDSEKYAKELIERKASIKRNQQRFRSSLDDQCQDRVERRQAERDTTHGEWIADQREYELWQEGERKKAEKLHNRMGVFKADQQKQLAQKADYRRKEKDLRAQQQRDFSDRVSAEQAEAKRKEGAYKQLQLEVVKGYMKETEASVAIKKELGKQEAVLEEKAKKEMKEQLDRSEREYKESVVLMIARQDAQEKTAVGKTWERRYIPDEVQEKHLADQNKKSDHEEAKRWAKKHMAKADLVEGLDHQLQELKEKRRFKNAEKYVWQKRFEDSAAAQHKVDEAKQAQLSKSKSEWKNDLDNNLRDFRYKEAYEPYAMHRTDRVLNVPHFGILSMGL